jgi:hypothetical protein
VYLYPRHITFINTGEKTRDSLQLTMMHPISIDCGHSLACTYPSIVLCIAYRKSLSATVSVEEDSHDW